ncbi:MAG: TRAP transporter small permease [Lachnospiraceae bacterium]|nr:TRAP transporter small permease [Lachnospiraceae bacterium]
MKVVDKICTVLTWVSGGATIIMMILILVDVITKGVFNSVITGLTEIITMLITCSFASFGATALANKHVKIDMVVNALPKKAAKVVDFISLILCLALCIILVWRHIHQGFYSMEMGHGYPTLKFPYWPFIFLFAIGFASGVLAIITKIVMLFKKGGDDEHPVDDVEQVLKEAGIQHTGKEGE